MLNLKKVLFLLFFAIANFATAQPYRISLLTCGVGQELYSCFGHSAIRVIDSASGLDQTYNYGMFDFSDPNFYEKFVKGTLLYFSAKENTMDFLYQYQADGREVKEQVLNISIDEALKIKDRLDYNNLEQNKYYHYDFCYVNCSTKLGDVLDSCLGTSLQWKPIYAENSTTFMQVLDGYLIDKHWERAGIDLILSSKVNDKMSVVQSRFLPELLSKHFAKATLRNTPLALPSTILVSGMPFQKPNTNSVWIVSIAIAILGLLLELLSNNNKFISALNSIFSVCFFTILGMLGCFFIFMWFGTNHLQTKYNLNMLWALPSHLLFAYHFKTGKKSMYALVSLLLALLSVPIFFFIQHTALEILPIVVYICFKLFRQSKWKK
jgi:hypothetical protein